MLDLIAELGKWYLAMCMVGGMVVGLLGGFCVPMYLVFKILVR